MADEGAMRGARILVFRHGPSESRNPARWPDDDRRPLSRKGTDQTRRAARGLARIEEKVRAVATSPAARAVRTAGLVRDAFQGSPRLLEWEELLPGRPAGPVFDRLQTLSRRGGSVVLVGHDPTLPEFVGLALFGEPIAAVKLTKAGAACVEFPSAVRPGAGQLVWLLTRKQLGGVRG